ncbi:MAG: hypothetical protein GX651_02955 [Methanomicrobiales archaeon]|nr:hypothetical protein [Methanomicrobiales archaeon]
MIPATPDEKKQEAFRLFEDGRYSESLKYCRLLLDSGNDPALEVLAASNLFLTGKIDDAEAAFLDLARKMPDSSYVHSYLAKVLEAKGDEGAIAEYVTAVHLDPTNQEALRSYAAYLTGHGDYRGALPVLRRLVTIGQKPADIKNLIRALTVTGSAEEALATFTEYSDVVGFSSEYIDALARTGNFHTAADTALTLYRTTHDREIFLQYLRLVAQYDLPAATAACVSSIEKNAEPEILSEYIRLLRSEGKVAEALAAARMLLGVSPAPENRLLECELLAGCGDTDAALAAYETLIGDELNAKDDLDLLRRILASYRGFIMTRRDPAREKERFLDRVASDVNVASLIETGQFCLDNGEISEARSSYYRAYRADFITGGLEYARFLILHGEDRECEKVMLYILANAKKSPDLMRVAGAILDENGKMYRLRRLRDQLVRRLEDRRPSLFSDGLELLAMAYFITATNALEDMDYTRCKYSCLAGMDILPLPPGRGLCLEDFLMLLGACKSRSVTDRAVLFERPRKSRAGLKAKAAEPVILQGLSDTEQKVIGFLRAHRKATEMDLRKLLGTRRAGGIVNLLIKKAAEQGIAIIDKKGVSEEGEVYEYTGT